MVVHSMGSRTITSFAVLASLALPGTACRQRTVPPAPPPDARPQPDLAPAHRLYPTAWSALAAVLKKHHPAVLGFGELHSKTDSAPVLSALRRFDADLLQQLSRSATDLVVETWVTEGRCGAQEKRVARKVEQSTKRPAETENEVVRLLKRSKALGVQPHILTVSCKEYDKLLTRKKGGQLDFEQLLGLITRHLRDEALAALKPRKGAKKPPMVLVYGGALHNDLYPMKELEAYSYAAAVQKATGGRYVELDLYVPELLEADELQHGQPWYPLARQLAARDRVVLLERGPGSYVLVLRRGRRPE
jgi:hypothetical protein